MRNIHWTTHAAQFKKCNLLSRAGATFNGVPCADPLTNPSTSTCAATEWCSITTARWWRGSLIWTNPIADQRCPATHRVQTRVIASQNVPFANVMDHGTMFANNFFSVSSLIWQIVGCCCEGVTCCFVLVSRSLFAILCCISMCFPQPKTCWYCLMVTEWFTDFKRRTCAISGNYW